MQKEQKAEQKECRKQKHAEGPEQKDNKRPLTGPVMVRVRAWSMHGPHGFGDPCCRAVNPCQRPHNAVNPCVSLHAVPDMLSSCFPVPSISDYPKTDTSCCRQAVMPSSFRAFRQYIACNTFPCQHAIMPCYNAIQCRAKACKLWDRACIHAAVQLPGKRNTMPCGRAYIQLSIVPSKGNTKGLYCLFMVQ